MKTTHLPIFSNAVTMADLPDASVDLVVTSPPYPMIQMWDETFTAQDPSIAPLLSAEQGPRAFGAMHRILDRIWSECFRVLKPGRFACINIGDATRTLGKEFGLYPNHSRILSTAMELGFTCLPAIIWRKQTNAPNKFMGSGMLPAGAYVTLEHEYILILRKGGKRAFTNEERLRRRESALFWEERNQWFSDVWMDIKGSRQALGDAAGRKRSGAFPFELAARLIAMYSIQDDLVLDPFLGLGTTMAGAMALGRNSRGYEINPLLRPVVEQTAHKAVDLGRELTKRRLEAHGRFMAHREAEKGPAKYRNVPHGMGVVTAQETDLRLVVPQGVEMEGEGFSLHHAQ